MFNYFIDLKFFGGKNLCCKSFYVCAPNVIILVFRHPEVGAVAKAGMLIVETVAAAASEMVVAGAAAKEVAAKEVVTVVRALVVATAAVMKERVT